MSSRRSILDISVPKGAKRKVPNSEKWKENLAKTQRQSGQEYTSKSTKTVVPGKVFSMIKKCCSEKCFEKINLNEQKTLFQLFYDNNTKKVQDTTLASCMTLLPPADRKKVTNPKVERNCLWKYSIKSAGRDVDICRLFLISVYQVGVKRIRLIQKKIIEQKPLDELRGKHGQQRKIQPSIYDLALKHLKSIPHKQTHYTPQKTNKLYFLNPDLTIKTIFIQFQDYFRSETGETLKMKYKTYFKFFRETQFDFKKPKTDICDYCRECEIKLQVNPHDPCHVEFNLHKKRVEAYDKLKSEYLKLASKENSDTMVLEFDYAQNLPLPKISVTKQFYKRLLWLYLFNVHVHNDGTSFIYSFLESECKKGACTVASFIFDCIQQKMESFPNVKNIVLMSDAAGGQNKNQTLLRFCSWMARVSGVEITHLFPVRGHSFNQCDRNFGVIRNALKRMEAVEQPDEYLVKISQCRENPSPFQVKHDVSLVYNWDEDLLRYFMKIPKNKDNLFRIQQYRILKYKPCGALLVSKTYHEVFVPFQYLKHMPLELNLHPMPRIPVKPAKMKDVRDLYVYIKPESRDFYEKLFQEGLGQNTSTQPTGNEEESNSSTSSVENDADEL